MKPSTFTTVDEYIASLPDDRKPVIEDLVTHIRKNIPSGFTEAIQYGMINWVVPHSLYPKGYHCDPKTPLPFLSLASQKNHIAIYHMGLYAGILLDWFVEKWKTTTPKKLDMGKSCVRFKKPEDIPFDLIGELVSKVTPAEWIRIYEESFQK